MISLWLTLLSGAAAFVFGYGIGYANGSADPPRVLFEVGDAEAHAMLDAALRERP